MIVPTCPPRGGANRLAGLSLLVLSACGGGGGGGGGGGDDPVDPPSDPPIQELSPLGDLNEGLGPSSDSRPSGFMRLGAWTYFSAFDEAHGIELWRFRDAPEDAERFLDLLPGPGSSLAFPRGVVRGRLLFVADDGTHGRELWSTDGTEFGTRMIVDLLPGPDSSSPSAFALDGTDRMFFGARGEGTGSELYVTDGSRAGTVLVRDINPGDSSAGLSLRLVHDGVAYFSAEEPSTGRELWRSDGTAAGTVRLTDIYPGEDGSFPSYIARVGNRLVFSARDATLGTEPHVYDLGTQTASLLSDIREGDSSSSPRWIVSRGDVALFAVLTGDGYEVWRTDGTEAGTLAVVEANSYSLPGYAALLNDEFFFGLNDELWASDGTVAGTRLVIAFEDDADVFSMSATEDRLFFTVSTDAFGREPWTSDGTQNGTRRVGDLEPGTGSSDAYNYFDSGSAVVFTARDVVHGSELWSMTTNGTSPRLHDLWTDIGSSDPMLLTERDGTLLVAAYSEETGRELAARRPDESLAFLPELNEGAAASLPNAYYYGPAGAWFKGEFYFSATDSVVGRELRATSGEPGSLRLVADIAEDARSSNPFDFVVMGDHLYFGAETSEFGSELWRTDGTDEGTVMVRDIETGSSDGVYDFTSIQVLNDALYFTGRSNREYQLWTSDGTDVGTTQLSDDPDGFLLMYEGVVVGNQLYFVGNDGAGQELWRTDGTTLGTRMVLDIHPGSRSSMSSNTGPLATDAGRLFFAADDGEHGVELWTSKGSAQSTRLVVDLQGGVSSSSPRDLAILGNDVFFAATTLEWGSELWVSDGTESGTRLVSDLAVGSRSSSPSYLVADVEGGVIYFVATSDEFGTELFVSDGTEPGTTVVEDFRPGVAGSNPQDLAIAGDELILSLDDGVGGRELFTFPLLRNSSE